MVKIKININIILMLKLISQIFKKKAKYDLDAKIWIQKCLLKESFSEYKN